jgi:hypothetical protein
MGTRADFYIGRGADAEWIGSTAWDGYPDGFEKLFEIKTVEAFRSYFTSMRRDDKTTPEMGWPWPWDDSRTTDYAYAFDAGEVWISCFGRGYVTRAEYDALAKAENAADYIHADPWKDKHGEQAFPNMKARANVTYGDRSGLLIFGG